MWICYSKKAVKIFWLRSRLIFFLYGSTVTTLFEGERNHHVPSASVVLRDSNLFQMAGRMISHSFIHGGSCLNGLSLPVVILLTGGSLDSAASVLTLEDCPDLDHWETISLASTCCVFKVFFHKYHKIIEIVFAFSIFLVLAAQENRSH